MIRLFRVRGTSMYPAYKTGQIVLCLSPKLGRLKAGDVVVFKDPYLGVLLKRILHCHGAVYDVTGDHYSSISCVCLGKVSKAQILGKVLMKI